VLIVGIIVMAVGGKTSAKYSNKLMTLRVILQAGVIFNIDYRLFFYSTTTTLIHSRY